ncbi:hypothetical protein B40-8011 [Bacteroides phage B40-8]|uniref:hypothetical protein n=1 Tax=Bacteroides phage B40-8 TaxID=99179 RepID=UPI00017FB650|nr:hypothetical protein B40-8011 [Bacteroides phage B40-8]ACH81947.1 hypothetical phage protein [Bacteroides phage B40-8]
MKAKITAIVAFSFLFLLIVCLIRYNAKLREENGILNRNVSVLTTQNVAYRTESGKSAMKTDELNLTLRQYRNTLQGKDSTIKDLKQSIKDLKSHTSIQTSTESVFSGSLRDSIIIRDSLVIDTMKCVNIRSKWLDLSGCIDSNGTFAGTTVTRDSLEILNIEHRKRFLWFRLKKVKYREFIVTSKNPYTEITGFNVTTIIK